MFGYFATLYMKRLRFCGKKNFAKVQLRKVITVLNIFAWTY